MRLIAWTFIFAVGVCAATQLETVARAGGSLLPPLTPPRLAQDSTSQGTADTWTTRRAAISANGATGGPLGYGGLSFDYAPWRYLVLGGGVGVQPGGGTGAFTWRLRLPINNFVAVGFGAPLSTGPYQWVGSYLTNDVCGAGACSYKVTRTWSWATWVHIEPSVELRTGKWLALRVYGGRSFMVAPADGVCWSDAAGGCPSTGGETQWYAGIAAGAAF
jgi:hypothetical protein